MTGWKCSMSRQVGTVTVWMLAVGPLVQAQVDPYEIIDRVDQLYRGESSHGTSTMEVVTENWDPTWFEDLEAYDIHVRNPGSNPWRELARWGLEDPQRDLDGASRRAVPGTVGAAGADEP